MISIKANTNQGFIRWTGDNCCDISDFLGGHDFYHKAGVLSILVGDEAISFPRGSYVKRSQEGKLSCMKVGKAFCLWDLSPIFDIVTCKKVFCCHSEVEHGFKLTLSECRDGRWFAQCAGTFKSEFVFDSSKDFKEPVFFVSLESMVEAIIPEIAVLFGCEADIVEKMFAE